MLLLTRLGSVAICAIALTACDGGRPGKPLPSEGVGASWRWRPTAMDVSALTTPIPSAGERRAAVDVRIVFKDDDGDECKAVGVLTVRVMQADTELASQVVDLAAKQAHSRTWDGVTETYAVRIELPAEPAEGRQVVVSVSFDGADGVRLSGTRDLRWPEQKR